MDDSNNEYIEKEVIEVTRKVVIIVTLIEQGCWQLNIRGKHGQLTTWTEYFASSGAAFSAGYNAILKEGINEFYSNEEFLYLDEL